MNKEYKNISRLELISLTFKKIGFIATIPLITDYLITPIKPFYKNKKRNHTYNQDK